MPKAHKPQNGLVDAWGRRNRSLADKLCEQCATPFHPKRASAKYCSRQCAWANNGGHNRKNESWWTDDRGYIEGRVLIDDKLVRVRQHRCFIEKHLGRPLRPDEDVHHVNGDEADNRIENLEVVTHGDHSSITNKSRHYPRGYKMKLSDAERRKRSERMKKTRRAALAKALGQTEAVDD